MVTSDPNSACVSACFRNPFPVGSKSILLHLGYMSIEQPVHLWLVLNKQYSDRRAPRSRWFPPRRQCRSQAILWGRPGDVGRGAPPGQATGQGLSGRNCRECPCGMPGAHTPSVSLSVQISRLRATGSFHPGVEKGMPGGLTSLGRVSSARACPALPAAQPFASSLPPLTPS